MNHHEVQTFHGLEVAGRRVRAHSGDEWKMADLRAEVPCTWEDQLLTPIDSLPIALPEPELGTGGAPNDVTGEDLETLRREQSEAVMPLIGSLLDAWEGTANDTRGVVEEDNPELFRLLNEIGLAMEGEDP